MEEEGRCARPREIPRHHTSKSHFEAVREAPGWEDPNESRAITTGIQQGQRGDRRDVCIKAAGREEVGDARENEMGFVDLEKVYDTVPREMAMATMRWMGVQKQKPGWWKQCMREQKEKLWLDLGCRKSFQLISV